MCGPDDQGQTSDQSPTLDEAPTAAGPARQIFAALVEAPGASIGPYKLLELIGEGGFGSVFMAEQHKPVSRKVALKIIKLGMDTREVVARFEQERQALAILDHPNIAKVFDAGATSTGRPYFVMELCAGEPIDAYCDRHRLDISQRLDLFTQVCSAVQHAHTKGLIHRDIKPSNVLVSSHDGKPHAKVIDFGIAKATASKLAEHDVFTEHKQMIGTPAYMSPEQAEGSLDIDTRTDIYSLGVLLYELLTGSTPFTSRSLRSAAYAEMLRIIREVEPPKPSTRLSQSSDTIASVAASRQTEPRRLNTTIRGELDWIAMKALEKDRARRYESANGLAADIRRYLSGEAVVAAPPSRAYKLRKFVKRHRLQVIAGGVVATALMVATGVSVRFAISEAAQRKEAVRQTEIAETNAAAEAKARRRAEGINAFVTKALQSSDPLQTGKQDVTIAQVMGNAVREIDAGAFKDDPATEADLKNTIGLILKNGGKYDRAKALFEQALATNNQVSGEDSAAAARTMHNLAALHLSLGQDVEAEPLLDRSVTILEKAYGPEHREVASGINLLAVLHYLRGNLEKAEPLFVRSLAIREKAYGPESREVAVNLNDFALLYETMERIDKAETLMKRAAAIYEKLLGPDHPDVAASLNSLAILYEGQGDHAKAEPLYVRALAICEKSLGPDHPLTATGQHNLADLYRRNGQYTQAEPLYVRALTSREKALGPDHADVSATLNNLAMLYKAAGRYAEAEPLFLRTVAIDERTLGPDHPDLALSFHNLASLYESQERFDKAEETFNRSLAMREKTLGPEDQEVASSLNSLALLYARQQKFDQAEPRALRAIDILTKARGPDHPDVAQVLTTLAGIHNGMGRTAEARQSLDRALSILRKRFPNGSPLLARVLWRSGSARFDPATGAAAAAALPELEEAVAMAEKLLSPEHKSLKEYRETLTRCKAVIEAAPPK